MEKFSCPYILVAWLLGAKSFIKLLKIIKVTIMSLLNGKQSPAMLKLLNRKLVSNEYLDYQFIQRSSVPTQYFQMVLPRLQVPELHLTCERYLAAQRPLLIDESYRKTESNVNQFQNGPGKQLQKLLKESNKRNKQTSYISEIWFDKYLKSRSALPINSNPMIVLHNDVRDGYNDQLIRATNLIISSLRFYKALKADLLEPEIYHLNPKKSDTDKFRKIIKILPPQLAYLTAYFYKAFPLDMSQYPNLFNTTRIPETDKDRLYHVTDSRHITVQYKGNFFLLRVLSVSGDILTTNEILNQLRTVMMNKQSPAEYPIGVLTTLERDKWATIRHKLCANNNENSLKMIDTALFNVCLDDEEVGDDPYKITRKFLHGDGTNRWFDKSFSLIVSKDGVSGLNFEHSWGDGVAVLRYAQDIYNDSIKHPKIHPDSTTTCSDDSSISAQLLEINLNDDLKTNIAQTKKQYKILCDDLDINYLIFDGIGKNLCKKSGISPDAVMQLAFQAAYNKLSGSFVPTYESCSTAAFKHGRTEAIRPLTVAAKEFCLAANSNGNVSSEIVKSMMLKCSEIHNRLIKEAAMGQGFDRHLFALKKLAENSNIQCNVFNDPEYGHMNHNILSTSTLSSPCILAGGFGPEVRDGLGIGYNISDDLSRVLVTSYKRENNGHDFVDALNNSFKFFSTILSK